MKNIVLKLKQYIILLFDKVINLLDIRKNDR